MNVREAVRHLSGELTSAGIVDSRLEASLIVSHVLKVDRGNLLLATDRVLMQSELEAVFKCLRRRVLHEPLQYVFGEWPFLDLQLEVSPSALIPRPETEEWVDRLLETLIPKHLGANSIRWFADIGAGTGAIGLALANGLPLSCGLLCDISPEAVTLAQRNLARHPAAASRLSLILGDLTLSLHDSAFDLVASNPPYIKSADMPGLMPEVRDHEPRMALDGGKFGTSIIARLLADLGRVLRPGGLAAFEHGDGQRPSILALPAPGLSLLEAGNDACGRERFLVWVKR